MRCVGKPVLNSVEGAHDAAGHLYVRGKDDRPLRPPELPRLSARSPAVFRMISAAVSWSFSARVFLQSAEIHAKNLHLL